MAWYRYWQQKGEDAWVVALEDAIPQIIEEQKPAFTTVLNLDTNLEATSDEEDYAKYEKVRFRGPFYVDFDGEDIEVVIRQVKRYLSKLEGYGVRLDELEYGLTGGRGVHILIPWQVFIKNPSSNGYQHLPLIYKEMAYETVVDTMDLRVYSSRRGRMWRTYNVQRDNGNYKVQVTYQEIRELTPEKYKELVASPRPLFQPPKPTYAPEFALLFDTQKDLVEKRLKGRRKGVKDRKLIEYYKGEVPPTIEKIMSGEVVDPDKGFHSTALQIAIAARDLGLTREEVLEKCEGLCNRAHESDGRRYNTPDKRRKELARLLEYMEDNPCYSFSIGGLKSVVIHTHDASDLDISDVPRAEEGDLEEEEMKDELFMGLIVRRGGIWRSTFDKEMGEEVQKKVSNVGISDVHELIDHETEESTGFELTIHVADSKPVRKKVNNNDFDSKINLRRALGAQNFINLPDSQIGALQEVFRAMATKTGNKVRTLPLEGVNVMTRDKPLGGTSYRVRWADHYKVWGFEYEGEEHLEFRLETPFRNEDGSATDLVNAPFLRDDKESREYFDDLFEFFPPNTTARVLGWYMACFLTQHIRAHTRQFPLLQSYGEAGSGKTSYNLLCANLHYYKRAPRMISAGGVTPFAMEAPLASSGTIPVIFDEFKPREMAVNKLNTMFMLMRNNFNGTAGAKGNVSRDSGHSQLGVANTANVAPMATISEAKVTMEAILHRSVLAAFPEKHVGSEKSMKFQLVKNRAWRMGQLGRVMLDLALMTKVETVGEQLEKIQNDLVSKLPATPDRTIFCYAVCILGLQLGQAALRQVFEDRYDETMNMLMDSVIGELIVEQEETKSMSEINRVINDLAWLSNRSPDESIRLVHNEDYSIITIGGIEYIDLNLRNCWDKYTKMIRSQNGELLFDRELSFVDAMFRHSLKVTTNFADNSSFISSRMTRRAVRLKLQDLYEKVGIDEFQHPTA